MGEETLIGNFLSSLEKHSERTALWVENREYSYSDVYRSARALGMLLCANGSDRAPCALLAYRTKTAYVGVLGAQLARRPYVPLNPRFPLERNLRILELSGAEALVVDGAQVNGAEELLRKFSRRLDVFLPDNPSLPDWARTMSHHRFVTGEHIAISDETWGPTPADSKPHDIAYIMFTSGSTGTPKGVALSQENGGRYIRSIVDKYGPRPEDRFSQMFDLTFDLSVHDMFVCWAAGATLFSVPGISLMLPASFVQRHQLTFWFSVPSTAALMKQFNKLKPGTLPSLRWSLFCGEPLPVTLARDWVLAAPQAPLENLYGPTEATIAFTSHRFDSVEDRHTIVPIGNPLPDQEVIVLGESGEPVPEGDIGELYLGGSQLAIGYHGDPALTRKYFIERQFLKKAPKRWYRTGDLVREDPDVGLIYLGRVDNQIKIRGYRVETQEIEAVLREAAGTDLVAVIAWPVDGHGAVKGVIAYLSGSQLSQAELRSFCKKRLPAYMVPGEIHFLERMPMNSNGKIDLNQLRESRQAAQFKIRSLEA